MAGFSEFLRAQAAKTKAPAELKRLIELADANAAEWPSHRDDIAAYLNFINQKAPAGEQEKLIAAVATAFGARNQKRPVSAGTIALAVAAMFVAIALGYGIYSGALISALGTPDYARGLITFLFATGTIAVVLIIAIAIFWVDVSEVGDRFTPAKDVLTILIGVLGTILGFYFGSATGEKAALALGDVAVTEDIVAPEQTATITGALSGGTAPYTFSVDFAGEGPSVPDDLPRTSAADGAIKAEVKMPRLDKATVLHFTVVASDAAGNEAKMPGKIFVAPTAAAEDAAAPPPEGGSQ